MKFSVVRTKIVSLVLMGALFVSNTVLGLADTPRGHVLAPPMATKPLCKIIRDKSGNWDVITDDDLASYWDRETARSVRAGETLGKSFRNRWAFADVSFLAGQALKLQISKHTLIPLIKKHIEKKGGVAEILLEGYDIDEIEEVQRGEEIIAFSLPVTRNGKHAYTLTYSLNRIEGFVATIPLSNEADIFVGIEPMEEEPFHPDTISGLPVTWTGGLKKDELRVACVQLGRDDFEANTERIKRIVEDLSRLGPNSPDMAVFPELMDGGRCSEEESQERVSVLRKVANDTKIAICSSMEHEEKIDGRRNITTDIIQPEGTEESKRYNKFNFGRENRLFSINGRKIALLMCVESIAVLRNNADARKVTEDIEQADLILVPSTTLTMVGEKWPGMLRRRFKKPVMFINMTNGGKAGRSTYIPQDDDVFSLNDGEAILMADVPEGPVSEPDAEERIVSNVMYKLWSGRESEMRQAREELTGLLNELPEYDEAGVIYAGNRTPLRAREIAQAAFYILGAEAITEMAGNHALLVDDRFETVVVEHIVSIMTREDAVDRLAELSWEELVSFWGDGDLDRRPLLGRCPLLTRKHVRYWTAIRKHKKVNPGLEKEKALYLASMGGVSEGLLAAGCRHLVMMEKKNFCDPSKSVRLSEGNRMIYREMKRSIKKGTKSSSTLMHDAAYQYLGEHLLSFVLDELDAMEARDIIISKKRLDREGRDYYEIRFKWAQWGMEYEDYVVTFIDNYTIRPQGIRESLKATLMDTLLKGVDILMLKAGLALSDESQPGDADGIYTSEDVAAALSPYMDLLGEDGVFVADVSVSRRSGILSCNKRLSYIPSGEEITDIESVPGGIWFGYNPVTLLASSKEEPAAPPETISGLPVTWTNGLEKEGLRVASVQLERRDFEQNTERIRSIVEGLSELGPNAPDLVIFPELIDERRCSEDKERERIEILEKSANDTGIAIGYCVESDIRTDTGNLVACHIIQPGDEEDNRRFRKFCFGSENRSFSVRGHKIALLICVETLSALKDTVAARKVSEEIENADLLLIPSATRLKSSKTWTQILQERYKKPVMLLNRADGDKAGNSSYRPYKNKVFSLGDEEEILIADIPEGLETGPDIGEKQARDILYRLWSEEKDETVAARAELSELLQDRFRTSVEDGIYVGKRTPLKAREVANAVFYILGEEAAERSGDIDLMVDDRFKNAIMEHILFILSQEDAVDHMARLNGLELANFWNNGDLDTRPLQGQDPLLDERHVRYWTAIRNHEKVNPDLEKKKALYLASMGGVSEGLLAGGSRHLIMMEKKNFYDSARSMRLSEKNRMMYREAKRSKKKDGSKSHGSLMHDAAYQYLGGHLLPFVLDELDAMEARDIIISKKRLGYGERSYYEIRFKWAQWGMEYKEYKVTFIDNFEIKPGSETVPAKVPFRKTLLKDIDILMLKAGLALSSEEHFAGTGGIKSAQDAAHALTPYIRLLNENGVFIGDVTEMIKKEILFHNKGLSYVQGGDEIRKIESEKDSGIWFGYNSVKLFLLSGERGIYPNSVEGIPVLWTAGFKKQGLRVACAQLQDDEFDQNTERIKNIVESLSRLGPDAPDLILFPEILDKTYCTEEEAETRIKLLQEAADRTKIAIGLCIEYESPDPQNSNITYNIIKPGYAGRHIVFKKTRHLSEKRLFSIKGRKMEILICIEAEVLIQNGVDLIAMSKEINGSDMIVVPAATSPEEVKKWAEELRRFFGKPVIYLNWSDRGRGGNTTYHSKEKRICSVEDSEAILMVDAFEAPAKEVPRNAAEEVPEIIQKAEPAVISDETERVQAQVFSDTIKLIQAKQEEQPIILALGTSWIKGYEKGRHLQYDAVNPLITSIREFCREKGITFIDRDDSGLLGAINTEMDKEGKKDAKVIVLAGKDTVTSDEFETLRSSDNIFMAGVDNGKLTVDSYMRLMEMMTLTLQLAFGRDIDLENPNILIKKHDRFANVYIFIPNAEPMDYEVLKEIYRVQIFA